MSLLEDDWAGLNEELAEGNSIVAKLKSAEDQVTALKIALAESENVRKRMVRDAETNKKYASESFVKDLIGTLDNLERAMIASDSGPLATGVAATIEQFLSILKRHGVVKIACEVGAKFDENFHQAVTCQDSDLGSGLVIKVIQSGFLFHDRVMRPASVVVST